MSSVSQLLEDFEFLDDWEDRYRYVIELGRELCPLTDEQRSAENKVQGCVSQVWLDTTVDRTTPESPVLTFVGDSDAHIVRGLIAVLFRVFSGQTAQHILETDAIAMFASMGLDDHLTPQRSNGLRSMVERIRRDAQAALQHAPAAS
ncbi:MAG: SufE family protein [Hyphomicrobiales bacterium]